MRAIALAVTTVSLALAGCTIKVPEPDPSTETSEQPAAARAAKSAKPAPVVRDFDSRAYAELVAAFAENHRAAEKKYANTRWRFTAGIREIGGGLWPSETAVWLPDIRNSVPALITFRSEGDELALKRGKSVTVTAICTRAVSIQFDAFPTSFTDARVEHQAATFHSK